MLDESPELAKLAMLFVKEVLGWQEAVFDSETSPKEVCREPAVEGEVQYSGFYFRKLGDVWDMAALLCESHTDTGLVLHRDWEKRHVATIQAETFLPAFMMGKSQPCDTPHEAILQACIHAHRRGFRIRDL
jgi:hypothetical protein